MSNISSLATQLKSGAIKTIDDTVNAALKTAQDSLDSKIKAANAAIAAANSGIDQLVAAQLGALNSTKAIGQALLSNLTSLVRRSGGCRGRWPEGALRPGA